MRKHNEELFDHICDYVERTGLHMDIDEEERVFSGGIMLEGPMRAARMHIFVLSGGLRVSAAYPLGADTRSAESVARVAEYVHRVNYGMNDGKFEFDYRDGEVGFSLYRDCTDGLPSDKVLRRSLVQVTLMLEIYADGLMETLFTDQPVAEIARDDRQSCHALDTMLALRSKVLQKMEEDDEDDKDDEDEALTGEWMPSEQEQEKNQRMRRFMEALIIASLRAKAAAAESEPEEGNKDGKPHA